MNNFKLKFLQQNEDKHIVSSDYTEWLEKETSSIITQLKTEILIYQAQIDRLSELEMLITEAVKKVLGDNSQKAKADLLEEEELFMTQPEAAKFLHITLPTLIRWKNNKKVPYYQQGRKVYYKKSELLKTFQKNEELLR